MGIIKQWHKVKVESLGVPYARVSLDGRSLHCSGLDVHMSYGNVPETTLYINSDPEFDIDTLLTVEFTPKTVDSAVNVLLATIKRNDLAALIGMSKLMKAMEEKNG